MTKEVIKQLLFTRKAQYSQLRQEQAEDNRYYESKDDLGIAKNSGYHEVRTGTGRALVEVPTRRLLGIPSDDSGPRKQADKYVEQFTKRKQFIDAFINLVIQEVKAAFKKALLRGESYFQVLLDESRWGKEPSKADKEAHERWELDCIDHFPIDFSSPDAVNIYPSQDMDRGVPRDVIIEYFRTAGEVKSKYPQWTNPRAKKDGTAVSWVEYWSAEWRAYYADWEAILPKSELYPDGILANTWGFVPFVHMFSGLGVEDPEGKPEIQARGVLYNYRSRLTALQRAVSFQDSDVMLHSHRSGEIRGATDADIAKYAETLTTAPGYWRPVTPGGPEAKLDEPAPLNEALFAHSASLQDSIEQQAHIALLSGSPRGMASGVQQGMSLGWARADYEDTIRNIEQGLSVAIGMVLRLIETVLKKPVTIRATVVEERQSTQKDVVLRPEDIDRFYQTDMKFKLEDKGASDIKKELGRQAYLSKMLPLRVVLAEFWDREDPDADLIQLYAEREIEENPILREQRNRMAAVAWGMEEAEARAAEEAELRKRTPPPQGTAAELAHGLPVRQYRRGLEAPGLAGGLGEFPMARGESLA